MADSPRYCATHKAYGDHHTDRCPLTYDVKSPEEHQWAMAQAQRKAMGFEPKPFPLERAKPTMFPLGTVLAAAAALVALLTGNVVWAGLCVALAFGLARVELKRDQA